MSVDPAIQRLLDDERERKKSGTTIPLSRALERAVHKRDLSTLTDDSGRHLVSGPLVAAVARSAVGAAEWMFDPILGPTIVRVESGEERRLVSIAPLAVGRVTALRLTAGGSGYTSAPTVTISGGGGSGATATATVAAGSVTGIRLTNPGAGFLAAPTVIIAGGSGTGATATASVETEGVDLGDQSPTFSEASLRFQTARVTIPVSAELFQDAPMLTAQLGEAIGAAIARYIERFLVFAPTGILGTASHPESDSEADSGSTAWNGSQILGGADEQHMYPGMLRALRALPDYVRADSRCVWIMSPKWKDAIYAIQTDRNNPMLYDVTSRPFGVPVRLLGAGAALPQSAADDQIRYAAVGVLAQSAFIALCGDAELTADYYSRADRGQVLVTCRQRFAARRWNDTWISTLRGPTFT